MENKLDHLLYISIPEGMNKTIGDFELDSSILVPIEVPGGAENLDTSALSWEMIIAAMMKIFCYQPDHENIEYYRNFVKAVRPNIGSELSQAAIAKIQQKEYDVAEEIFLSLYHFSPEEKVNLQNLAFLYEERAENYRHLEKNELEDEYLNKCEEIYKDLLSSDNPPVDSLYHSAFFFLGRKQLRKAHALFSDYLQQGQDDEKLEKVKEVLQKMDSLLENDDLFKESYDAIREGREEEGIATIKEFLASNESVWNAWFLLGWGYRRLEQYDQAKEAFLKALEGNPEHGDTYNELAICRMELGEYDQAKKDLSKALHLDPENLKIISNMGILAMKQENYQEARSFFEAVLELDKNDEVARHYLTHLDQNT